MMSCASPRGFILLIERKKWRVSHNPTNQNSNIGYLLFVKFDAVMIHFDLRDSLKTKKRSWIPRKWSPPSALHRMHLKGCISLQPCTSPRSLSLSTHMHLSKKHNPMRLKPNSVKKHHSSSSNNWQEYRICFELLQPTKKRRTFLIRGLAIPLSRKLTDRPHEDVSTFSVECVKFPESLNDIKGRRYIKVLVRGAHFRMHPSEANCVGEDMTFDEFKYLKDYGLFTIRRQIRFTLNQKFAERKKWRVSGGINFNAAEQGPNWKPFSSGSLIPSSGAELTEGARYECMADLMISGKPLHANSWCWKIVKIELKADSPISECHDHDLCNKASAIIIDKEGNVLLMEKQCTTDAFIELGYKLQRHLQKHVEKNKPARIYYDELKGQTRKELNCLKDNSFKDKDGTKLKLSSDLFWGGYGRLVTICGEKRDFCERIDRILSEDCSNEPGKHKLPRFEPNQRIFTLPGGKVELISWEFDDTLLESLECKIRKQTNLDIREMERLTPEPIRVYPVVPEGALVKSVFNSSLVHVYKCNLNLKESKQLKKGREFCGKKLVSIHSFEEDEELGGELNAPVRMVLKKVKEALFTELNAA